MTIVEMPVLLIFSLYGFPVPLTAFEDFVRNASMRVLHRSKCFSKLQGQKSLRFLHDEKRLNILQQPHRRSIRESENKSTMLALLTVPLEVPAVLRLYSLKDSRVIVVEDQNKTMSWTIDPTGCTVHNLNANMALPIEETSNILRCHIRTCV